MRITALVVLSGFTAFAALAQSERDFSGRWILEPAKSVVQGLPHAPDPSAVIEQQASGITWTGAAGTFNYNLNGAESRNADGATKLSSRLKWEGATLLIDTIVSSPNDSYSMAERWQKARDGNGIMITEHIARRTGDSESILMYAREGTVAAPVFTNKGAVPESVASVQTPTATNAEYVVPAGTKLPLRLINAVSTRHSVPGDKVYLETTYPILENGRIIIPPNSYVIGSLTEVKRAGRVKGKSELFLRLDSLTLPNGVTRDFKARLSNMDGDAKGKLDRSEGKIQGEGAKGSDAKTVGEVAAAGTGIGAIAGSAAGHMAMGSGIGAAAGALGGLVGVLSTRGPETVLEKGTSLEMLLDRDLHFQESEILHWDMATSRLR